MKILFIPAKSRSKINKSKILEISKKLPKNIVIAYSIQYKEIAEEIKEILSKNHNIIKITQVLGCSQPLPLGCLQPLPLGCSQPLPLGCSQPLGCSKPQFPKNTQAVLLISDGKFHAVSLAVESHLPIYILNNNNFNQISKQEIQTLERKQKASYVKFLDSNKIGVLVSTKPGQENLKKSLEFKKSQKSKKSYLFIGNEINSLEFENFPQIQSWVNTACPRLDMNSNVVNLEKIN